MSLRVSLVKVKQNLFIYGERDPGSVPQAYPEIPIIRQQSRTQKYLNYGRQPFFTRLWQVISMARAMRKSPKLCRVFFSKNMTEIKPPTKPANRGMYFCLSSPTHRRSAQRMLLKMSTKLPTKRPKLSESLLRRTLSRWDGDLKIRLMPNTAERPHLIKQLKKVIRLLSLRMASMHPSLCLHAPDLEQGICNFCNQAPRRVCSSSSACPSRGSTLSSSTRGLFINSACSCCSISKIILFSYPTTRHHTSEQIGND